MQTTIKGLGVDIAPITRITKLVARYEREILNLLFTASEINQCQAASNSHQYYAICFATKEAVGKALGTGIVGIAWNEIEANIIDNKLTIHLYGEASSQAKKRDIQKWLASWFHWDDHVLVHVLALGNGMTNDQ
ncbi:holo-ACP synthase [Nostoc sp.]|uniref:holo-ACP synthase n=1 Tax=Nostoc sp. TaxID=1180 RepID=UPI0035936EBD